MLFSVVWCADVVMFALLSKDTTGVDNEVFEILCVLDVVAVPKKEVMRMFLGGGLTILLGVRLADVNGLE